MSSSSASISIPTVVSTLILILLLAPTSQAVISCKEVIKDLKPCVNYLVSGSGKPPVACCDGAKALASSASTSADKKATCECIKSAAKNFNLNTKLAQALPANCGISLSFSISPNSDCAKLVSRLFSSRWFC